MTEKSRQSAKASTINSSGSMGGLLGLFVIACVECQRLWPTGTSLIYLVICIPLLLIWIAYLAGWKLAERNAGLAIDISIYVLVVASVGISFGSSRPARSELASTLLFWAPLVSAWWAWRYRYFPLRLWILLGGFFVVLTWQLASEHKRLDEHLILSLLVALVMHYAYRSSQPANPESNMNLRDPLTGLPSAECFEAELAHISAISDRYGLPLSLIGCRIGPAIPGSQYDELLCQYAEAIADRLRTADTICQWDRTTFMILLPSTSESKARTVANSIQKAFNQLDFGQKPPLTAETMVVQHEPGDDPMSTVGALESKLAKIAK